MYLQHLCIILIKLHCIVLKFNKYGKYVLKRNFSILVKKFNFIDQVYNYTRELDNY